MPSGVALAIDKLTVCVSGEYNRGLIDSRLRLSLRRTSEIIGFERVTCVERLRYLFTCCYWYEFRQVTGPSCRHECWPWSRLVRGVEDVVDLLFRGGLEVGFESPPSRRSIRRLVR